ncbi:rhomboid-related 4 [Brachionus plicatilis]|uniref:Rhomboid-related 4 n=1 Tax=Brachionus plicatilis TaxID=10195 RepID=A0A3M7Q0R8_BRAPC|nr:rhomboid-related 4 [Brachionus plicatilis]
MRREKPKQAAFLLIAQLLRSDRIPPVTLAVIAINICIYLELFEFNFPTLGSVCLSFNFILYNREWKRILLSPFFHGDDWHLYYNMISFSIKGRSMEQKYGSFYFAILLSVFSVSTGLIYLAIEYLSYKILETNYALDSCAIGFSGVIFALKVLTTHDLPSGTIYGFDGIQVPSKYAYWFELIIISLLTPNVSFAGHLAGIVVGLLYINGPLKILIDFLSSIGMERRPRFYTTHSQHRRYGY